MTMEYEMARAQAAIAACWIGFVLTILISSYIYRHVDGRNKSEAFAWYIAVTIISGLAAVSVTAGLGGRAISSAPPHIVVEPEDAKTLKAIRAVLDCKEKRDLVLMGNEALEKSK